MFSFIYFQILKMLKKMFNKMFKVDCVCCLESTYINKIKTLRCGHKLCVDCFSRMLNYIPECGKMVNLAMCKCPACATYINYNNLHYFILRNTRYLMNQHAIIMRCKLKKCQHKYYIAEVSCNANEDNISKLCPRHRPTNQPDVKLVICPHCSISIIRDGGCDVCHCVCGGKMCFGCGVPLVSTQTHWSCKGNYTNCADSLLSNTVISNSDKRKIILFLESKFYSENQSATHHTDKSQIIVHYNNAPNLDFRNKSGVYNKSAPHDKSTIPVAKNPKYLYRVRDISTTYSSIMDYNRRHIRRRYIVANN